MQMLPPHILSFLSTTYGDVISVDELKSAQQEMYFVTLAPSNDARHHQRVVVRQWKGASRWWNLNQAGNVQDLMTSELEGYRRAKELLLSVDSQLKIPQILHVSSTKASPDRSHPPWAVLEYIGEDDNDIKIDNFWTDAMIPTRREFGWEEPHPRWGRVPESQSLDYAMLVLEQVVVPLHKAVFLKQLQGDTACTGSEGESGMSYMGMVNRYLEACDRMMNGAAAGNESVSSYTDQLSLLKQCIVRLQDEAQSSDNRRNQHRLPNVVLHLDCQPQNLMFLAECKAGHQRPPTASSPAPTTVYSVLDWEDAAFGDLRFELVLLGRKVCSNLEQAKVIWTTYEQRIIQSLNESNPNGSTLPCQKEPPFTLEVGFLGSIEPWLRLESIHSLTTMMLEATRLSPGRATKGQPELSGKLEREWSRLRSPSYGWDRGSEN